MPSIQARDACVPASDLQTVILQIVRPLCGQHTPVSATAVKELMQNAAPP
jgi:hypothetical protein